MTNMGELRNNGTGSTMSPLYASVSLPEKQARGRARATDFLITSQFPNASESLVRRTWDDFVWAQKQLVKERAGIIVPVLPPPSKTTDRSSEEYIQDCQGKLHRFLQRILHHPELGGAPCLLPFFTANPADWKVKLQDTAAKEKIEASTHSSATDEFSDPNSFVIEAQDTPTPQKQGRFGKWFSEKKDKWALRNRKLVLEETPAETKKFSDLQEYAEHLETCIRILSEDSKKLLETTNLHAHHYQTMGAAFTQLWGEHELSNTSSSTMYQTVGACWTKICKATFRQEKFATINLDFPLEELVLDVLALKATLEHRKAAVYDYTKRVQEGRRLQVQMEKLKGVGDLSAHSDQYFQLERDIRSSDVIVAEKKKYCELVTSRLERDMERFRIEWHERMREVLEIYHKKQIEYLTEQTKLLQTTLPTLASIVHSRSDLPQTPQAIAAPELTVSYTTTGARATFGGSTVSDDGSGSEISYPAETAPPPMVAPPDLPASGTSDFVGLELMTDSFNSVGLDDSDAAPPAAGPPPLPTEAPPPPPTEAPPSPPKEAPPPPPVESPGKAAVVTSV